MQFILQVRHRSRTIGVHYIDISSVSEIAKRWKVNPRSIKVMCKKGKIQGAEKIGNMWMIPTETERPVDERVKSGKYIKKGDLNETDLKS